MPEKLSDRAVQRIGNAVAAGIRETMTERVPLRKVAKKKRKGAGFGGSMPIPTGGGTVSRTHGTGITRTERKLKPIKKMTRTERYVEPPTRKKRKKKRKVKV